MITPEDAAHYIAPAATMIAACMTAANLGPRVTGWGFVVFTGGSLGWVMIGIATGQQSLLVTNAFLTLVNLVGVWRWLGRIARFEDGAKTAEVNSRASREETLVNVGSVEGRPILNGNGTKVGAAIGVMAHAERGTIAYVVAGLGGVGGLGERVVALPWERIDARAEGFFITMAQPEIDSLDDLDPKAWPHAS